MDQKTRIVEHLQNIGPLTAKDAQELYGIGRLASRVFELKKLGIPVKSRTVTGKNRFGESVSFSEYYMGKDEGRDNCPTERG